MDHDKRIAEMDREELRDQLIVTQEKINDYMRLMRKNFEKAMSADKKKERIEERLAELEDWGMEKPKGGARIHVVTPPNK